MPPILHRPSFLAPDEARQCREYEKTLRAFCGAERADYFASGDGWLFHARRQQAAYFHFAIRLFSLPIWP